MGQFAQYSEMLAKLLSKSRSSLSQAKSILNNFNATPKVDTPRSPARRRTIAPTLKPTVPHKTSNIFPKKMPIAQSDKARYPFKKWMKVSGKPGYFQPIVTLPGMGEVVLTSGFMDAAGSNNGDLEKYRTIFFDKILRVVGEGKDSEKFGVGVNYRPMSSSIATSWLAGEVVQAEKTSEYGNRVVIKTNTTYKFEGEKYPVFQAYAGLGNIITGKGSKLKQGGSLGHSPSSATESINIRTFIITNNGDVRYHTQAWIELHPNLIM